MSRLSCNRRRFTIIAFHLIWMSLTFFFVNAFKDAVDKPCFTYLERWLLRITYRKGPNRTLYACCKESGVPGLRFCMDGTLSICPKYESIKTAHCSTKGDKVRCQVSPVLPHVQIRGYVGWFNGNNTVPLSDVATYVTNRSEQIPRSVSSINVTTNSRQGLDIHWSPVTEYTFRKHDYCVNCQPQENERAKAVLKCVDFGNSELAVDSKNLTAVSKYRCCVTVVNVVNSRQSEPICRNVTTSEKAPTSSPVIICGSNTKQCPFEIKGLKRNITILFELPTPEGRNGKIIKNVMYYRNTSGDHFKNVTFINGSQREAVLTNMDINLEYFVYMKSCTEVGCSPVSNTIIIPAVTYTNENGEPYTLVTVLIVVSLVVCSLLVIFCCVRRYKRQQRQKQLPTLKPESNLTYNYPDDAGKKDEIYDEIHSDCSSVHKDDAIVIENIMA